MSEQSIEEIEARLKEIDLERFQLLEDLRKQRQEKRGVGKLTDLTIRAAPGTSEENKRALSGTPIERSMLEIHNSDSDLY